MANQNLLTHTYKTTRTQQDYYSPVAILPGTSQSINSTYCFLSKVDPWTDDNNPDTPTQDQKYIKSVYKNMFVAKKITTNNISPVIQRIDWTLNTVYDYYRDDVDMLERDTNGFLIFNFYVRNSFNQVFKCLWNNNGAYSVNEPIFQPGTYNTNAIFQNSDGYKWKYMYTIDLGSKRNFMDSSWMPVPITSVVGKVLTGQTLDPTETSLTTGTVPGSGDIEVINVTNGGSGYNPSNSAIFVTITGDGIGANGSVVVANGSITDIQVTNIGTNYIYANVIISSTTGSGATAIASSSPIGGHGYDPLSELGCQNIMYVCEFNSNEGGTENGLSYIPTDIDYRQVGLLINPLASSTYPNWANAAIYNTATDAIVFPGFGEYVSDENVYQYDTNGNQVFSATVLSFDPGTNVINLINITGTPILNSPISGNVSKTSRTLNTVITPDFITFSGYITFIQNRTGVQRSFDGIEQYKFVLQY